MNKTNTLILSSWSLDSTKGRRNETINQPNMVGKMYFIKLRKSGESGGSLVDYIYLQN